MQLIHGDCFLEMRDIADNSIDCIVTDPPYGLSFMGKKWDKEVPNVDYWKQALRIAKPGSFLLAAGAPRSHHHLAMAIENAGWEITDCIMHIFGSGFPKGKSSLKPAYEPWILARKKADKVQYLNIDECRIPTESNLGRITSNGSYEGGWKQIQTENNPLGRWPANIILGDEEVEEMLDEHTKDLKSGHRYRENHKVKSSDTFFIGKTPRANFQDYNDSGGASRFFYCAKASKSERNKGCENLSLKDAFKFDGGDKLNQWTGKLETETKMQNHHPTVKPQKLMEYLIKLVMPKSENAILLDPFMGSGSTLVAAKNLGFNAIGIEMNEEYFEIAKRRVESIQKELTLF